MAILNIQPPMCSNGPVAVQTYILLRLCGKTWKLSFTVAHHPSVWLNWSYFPKKNGHGEPSRLCRCRAGGDKRRQTRSSNCSEMWLDCLKYETLFRFFFLFRIVCCVSFSLHLAVVHCFVTAPLKYISVCGNNVTRRGIVQAVWILFAGTVYVGAGFCFLSELLQLCTSFSRLELCILVKEEVLWVSFVVFFVQRTGEEAKLAGSKAGVVFNQVSCILVLKLGAYTTGFLLKKTNKLQDGIGGISWDTVLLRKASSK